MSNILKSYLLMFLVVGSIVPYGWWIISKDFGNLSLFLFKLFLLFLWLILLIAFSRIFRSIETLYFLYVKTKIAYKKTLNPILLKRRNMLRDVKMCDFFKIKKIVSHEKKTFQEKSYEDSFFSTNTRQSKIYFYFSNELICYAYTLFNDFEVIVLNDYYFCDVIIGKKRNLEKSRDYIIKEFKKYIETQNKQLIVRK